jgi:sporulation protein YlmC with PRC-barrel domain
MTLRSRESRWHGVCGPVVSNNFLGLPRRIITMEPALKPWLPSSHDDYDRLEGKEVYTRDGENVGSVKSVYHPDEDLPLVFGDHAILVDTRKHKKWFNDLDEVYLPETDVVGIGDDRIMLGFTAQHVKDKDWPAEAVLAPGLGITTQE